MKRAFYFVSLALLVTVALPVNAGEVIDGVIASVNRHPILRSDWDEAINFEAFMQQRSVADMGPGERALTLKRLVDRQLLFGQMGDARYMEPTNAKLHEDVARLRAQVPGGNDATTWRNLLAAYGLNQEMFERHLRKEVQVMSFIEVRLRPTVHVNDEEVLTYYRNQLLPDLQKNGGKEVPLDEVKPRIHELLVQQRIDELLDAWLHNLRQQADITSRVAIPGLTAPEPTAGIAGAN